MTINALAHLPVLYYFHNVFFSLSVLYLVITPILFYAQLDFCQAPNAAFPSISLI